MKDIPLILQELSEYAKDPSNRDPPLGADIRFLMDKLYMKLAGPLYGASTRAILTIRSVGFDPNVFSAKITRFSPSGLGVIHTFAKIISPEMKVVFREVHGELIADNNSLCGFQVRYSARTSGLVLDVPGHRIVYTDDGTCGEYPSVTDTLFRDQGISEEVIETVARLLRIPSGTEVEAFGRCTAGFYVKEKGEARASFVYLNRGKVIDVSRNSELVFPDPSQEKAVSMVIP